jgi:hypothetical protein
MAFDQKTRNLLQRTVTACRRALDREFTTQLQELYGIQPDGSLTPIAALDHLGDEQLDVARLLRERINHLEGGSAAEALTRTDAKPEHIARVIREQAFTVLNRLAALRLCEERLLVLECVRQGGNSEGFKLFMSSAGNALGETHEAYRIYLHCLFDELAIDLGVLFDRFSPLALLFPRHDALTEVLSELNGTGKAAEREEMPPEQFAQIWQADETIGWIYQYYNDETERKKMREESAAPRDSRELAVRNQFFTPRYVVEFLTDNTLGRIWYEMTGGNTSLKKICRYLVRRPDEVFLGHLTDAKAEHSEEGIIEMARLLIEGRESDWPPFNARNRQPLINLGHAVNGYQRLPDSEKLWGGWFEKATKAASRGEYLQRTTQEILDLLFIVCRNDRATDSTMSGELWFIELANEVRRRALRAHEVNLPQEDLLKQPVFISHRPIKDPRTILMLDPACGSMHFGLYAFDLYEIIYAEAWDIEEVGTAVPSRPPGMKSLHETYADKQSLLRDIPKLIIEHNIHGIDIDPRAAQIAGLALWLRAQNAWKAMDLKPADRPRITRSNIVCAEPMPGEKELLREFVEKEFPAAERGVFLQLLETIFDKMQLAGEAGSLLKIEEEIRSAIEDARTAWQILQTKPSELFSTTELNAVSKQAELTADSDLRPLTSDFWQTAESRLLTALRDYAEQAESGGGFQRRLFAEDAAHGFAFIDVCRKRYDVALMNPPFGDPAKGSKLYLEENYVGQPFELYANFVERFSATSNHVGAITSHTFLTYGSLTDYRKRVLMPNTQMRLLADFGLGVMDAAMVRSAAYILESTHSERDGIYFRLVEDEDKQESLQFSLQLLAGNKSDQRRFIVNQSAFLRTDQCSYAYWAESLLDCFDPAKSIGEVVADILLGVVTSGNDQFLRLAWEVSPNSIQRNGWAYYCKGGDFQKYFRAPHLVIDWRKDGGHIAAGNSSAVRLRDTRQYFRPGLTFPLVNEFGISVSVLPGNSVFDNGSPSVFPENPEEKWLLLGLLNSRVAEFFIRCLTSTRHWQVGYVRQVPWPYPTKEDSAELAVAVREACQLQRQLFEADETLQGFVLPELITSSPGSLKQVALLKLKQRDKLLFNLIQRDYWIDEKCLEIFRLSVSQRELVKRIIGPHPLEIQEGISIANSQELGGEDVEAEGLRIHRVTLSSLENIAWKAGVRIENIILQRSNNIELLADEICELCSEVTSYLFGCVFSRWDIRYATGEQAAPELPEPFAPLPVCPPGQLQNVQALPARPEDVPATYPITIQWDGIIADDPTHPVDIERCVREVIEEIWKDRANAIEQEACEILGVNSLRDYFRRPAGFFADHLDRYSKSKRQAPIYWPLSTASGSYTLWIYYHRLDDQTLYKCIQQFIDPKLADVEKELTHLRAVLAANEGGAKERKRLEELETLRRELIELRTELELWAPKWKPNLNDGVLITAAPLWKLFRLPKWQKDLKACWQELERGEYDWSHLAYTLWPDRVREKCKSDRSLAIAHGLEDLCAVKAPEKKVKKAKKKMEAELENV